MFVEDESFGRVNLMVSCKFGVGGVDLSNHTIYVLTVSPDSDMMNHVG